MTGVKSSALVPALGVPSRSSGESGTRQRRRAPLPLTRLAVSRVCRTVFGVAVMDNRGRVHDVVVQRALAWEANTRLAIREQAGVILINADQTGMFRISNDGYLRLPLTVRHWCGLVPGDRVLLATNADDSGLTLYPPARLDALLFPASASASVGDAA
jgi:hypothetical protein